MKKPKKIKYNKNIFELYAKKITFKQWFLANQPNFFEHWERCNGYYWQTDHLIVGGDQLMNLLLAHAMPLEETVTICHMGNPVLDYQSNQLFGNLFQNVFGENYHTFLKKNKRRISLLPNPLTYWAFQRPADHVYSACVDVSKKHLLDEPIKFYEPYCETIEVSPDYACEIISHKNYFTTPNVLIFDEEIEKKHYPNDTNNIIHQASHQSIEHMINVPIGKTLASASIRTDDLERFFIKIYDDLSFIHKQWQKKL